MACLTAGNPLTAGSGGIGSVSAGISEAVVEGLLPIPLACHALAQVCARRAGADVRRWWRRHVTVLVALLFVGTLAWMTQPMLSSLLMPLCLLLALVVFVGQHVAIAMVIVAGMQALANQESDVV